MAAEDPLTPGEITRGFKRLEDEDRSLAARLTLLAAEMLPVKLWESEHRALSNQVNRHETSALADNARLEKAIEAAAHALGGEVSALRSLLEREVEDLRDEIKDLREERNKRSEITWQKIIGLLGILIALATVIVALVGQSKGIK